MRQVVECQVVLAVPDPVEMDDGRADLRSEHLTIQCQNDGDTWQISHFRTLNLFSRRVERWSDVAEIPVPYANQTEPPA